MAKGTVDIDSQCSGIVADVLRGVFAPVYLLMGEEPYYIDMVCDAIVENALDESERDFNQTVCYGLDVDADYVVTAARRFPMMAERQLVVVKEAQMMKNLEDVAVYCEQPLDSTVLVLCVKGKSADKRKALYKNVSKCGVVVESEQIRDYKIASWISSFYSGKGLQIDPDAAALLGEYAGTDLGKIALETEKMLKNLPEGTVRVTASDIESNVGISRQFSVFELTKELSARNAPKALRIAAYIGNSPKFALPMVTGALFTHFYRILRYHSLLMKTPNPPAEQKARVLGVNPYFFREYDMAVANYPLKKCMRAVALVKEYDFKGKGGNAGEATPEQLLIELVAKLLD